MLAAARAEGLTPFLDLILSSPQSGLDDLVETLSGAYRWLRQGCEIGMYPYIIPFSGAAFSRDPMLLPHTRYVRSEVAGTSVAWDQAAKILPIDPLLREVILRIEEAFEAALPALAYRVAHLPSRVRSLQWILSAIPILEEFGYSIAHESDVRAELIARLPAVRAQAARRAAASA